MKNILRSFLLLLVSLISFNGYSQYTYFEFNTSQSYFSNINPGSSHVIIYSNYMYSFSAPSTITNLAFNMTGSASALDITSYSLYTSTNSFFDNSATLIGTISGVNLNTLTGSVVSFVGLNFPMPDYYSEYKAHYFYLAASVSPTAVINSTFQTTGAFYTAPPIASNNYSSASVGTKYTVTTVAGYISSIGTGTYNLTQGQTDAQVFYFYTYMTGGTSYLKSITFPIGGTFSGTDFDNLKLYYNSKFVGSITGASIAGPAITFTPSYPLPLINGAYFYMYASVTDNAQSGDAMNIISFAGSYLEVENLTLTGSTTNLTSLKISSSQISISDVSVPSEDISPGSVDNIIYKTKITPNTVGALLNHATFTTTGTFTSGDVSVFNLWVRNNATFSNSNSYKIATITATGSGQILDFTNFRKYLTTTNWYLYLTADFKPAATINRTISIAQPDVNSSFGFLTGTISGATSITGVKTIRVPSIAISQSNLSDAKIGFGTSSNLIYRLKVSATIAKAILDKVVFNLGGDFTSNESSYFRISYGSTSDFASASQITAISNYNGANSSISFTGLNTLVPVNTDIYLFLSIDAENGGSINKTIKVLAGSLNDLGFASASKSGNISVGSNFTFDKPVISASSIALASGVFGTGTTENPVYKIQLDVSNAPAQFQSLNLTTSGTYTSQDINGYYAIRLYYSKNDIYGDGDDSFIWYHYGPNSYQSNSTGSGENLSFNNGKFIPLGKSYLFVIFDIANTTSTGHTINIKSAKAIDALSFAATTVSGILDQGATFTIKGPNPIITTLSLDNSTILAPDNDEKLIYSMEVNTDLVSNINKMDFTIGGTFNSSDVYYYYIYKTNSPVFNPNNNLGTYFAYASAPGDVMSVDLGSFPKGKTYLHFFAYIYSSATSGHTIKVETVSGITISNGTSVKSISPGNTYTVLKTGTIEPFNVQPFKATAGQFNFLYAFKITSNYNSNYLQNLVLSLSGTIDPALLSNYTIYYSSNNNALNANYYTSGTYGTVSGQNVTFSGLNISSGVNSPTYIFIGANIASTSITGSTIRLEPTSLNDFIFSGTTVLGSFALSQSHVLTTPLVSVVTTALPSKNLNPDGTTYYSIYKIELNSNTPAILNSLPISITGNYTSSEIDRFRVYQSESSELDLNNYYDYFDAYSSKADASTPGENFNVSLNTVVPAGKTYFYVTVRLNTFTMPGITIQMNNLSVGGVKLSSGTVSGNSTNGNVFAVKNSSVALSVMDVPAIYLSNYNFNEIYTIKAIVTDADVKINNLTFQTKGTYSVSDIQYLYFYISKSPVYSPADSYVNTIYLSNLNAETTISLSSEDLTVGDNYIHFIARSVGAASNKTIGINAITLTSGNFSGLINVSSSLSGGNLFTTSGNYLGTYVTSTLPVPGGKINKGSTKVIYGEKVQVSNSAVYLNYFYLEVAGVFTGSDVTEFKLWYSKNSTFDNSAVSVSGSNISYPYEYLYLYLSNSLAIGDHYFYVTADVSASAISGNTFYIASESGLNVSVNYALSGTGVSMRGSDFIIGVPSNNNDIVSFGLPNQIGTTTISGTNISLNLPAGTDLTNLNAAFGIDGDANAFVGATKQISGISINNFSSPVTYKVVSETGLIKNYIVTASLISVPSTSVTGIDVQSVATNVEIYPNPAKNSIFVKSNGITSLEILDLIGNAVLQTIYTNQATIDISNLVDGVYFAKFTNKNGSIVKKVVVSK